MNDQRTYPTAQHAQEIHWPSEGLRPTSDLARYFRQYVRERPVVVALWGLGIGFVLGWKLKPW